MISKQLQEAVLKIFQQYGETITVAARESIAYSGKNATGTLSDSFSFEVITEEDKITLEISAEAYLKYIENGRGAGSMPPMDLILKWIRAKGLQAKGIISKVGMRRFKPALIRRNVTVSENRMAFAVARSIQKRGITAKPFFKPLVIALEDQLSRDLDQAVAKAIEKDITDSWNEGPNTDNLTSKINI